MLAKCSVFIATSLDGFIARQDGSIDWLMKASSGLPAEEDGGYKEFIKTVDYLIMGRRSYEKVCTFEPWPYGALPVIVLTREKHFLQTSLPSVSFSDETPRELVQRLSEQGAKHLYIDGGITVQRFLAEGLINQMIITLIPILLGSGLSLFGELAQPIQLTHLETRTIHNRFVQIKYKVANEA